MDGEVGYWHSWFRSWLSTQRLAASMTLLILWVLSQERAALLCARRVHGSAPWLLVGKDIFEQGLCICIAALCSVSCLSLQA